MKAYIILGIITLLAIITIWPIGILGIIAIVIKGIYDIIKRQVR